MLRNKQNKNKGEHVKSYMLGGGANQRQIKYDIFFF